MVLCKPGSGHWPGNAEDLRQDFRADEAEKPSGSQTASKWLLCHDALARVNRPMEVADA
jgi:hypothetical protein